MFPEPTELPLTGYLIESVWTLKSKSSTLTPKTNSQTYWPREISQVMNGTIFCVRLTSAISVPPVVLKWCRKERKKMQVKKESQQSRSRWWIWSREAAKGLLMCYLLLQQKAHEKQDMKVNFLWARELSSIKERGDPLWTLTHQATENGMLIKLGVLKSGNLMNWWKLEQGDMFMNNHPVCSQSTRTNFCWWRWYGLWHRRRIRHESPRPPPKISWRNDWMKELGSEVARQAEDNQPTQPNPSPNHRTERPVVTEQTFRSSAQEIDTRFSLDCKNINLFVERLEKDKDTDKDVDADRDRERGDPLWVDNQPVRPHSSKRWTSFLGCLDCQHAVVKQAENSRVRELVKKIESHPHRQDLQADLQQNNAYNPFNEK